MKPAAALLLPLLLVTVATSLACDPAYVVRVQNDLAQEIQVQQEDSPSLYTIRADGHRDFAVSLDATTVTYRVTGEGLEPGCLTANLETARKGKPLRIRASNLRDC